MQRHAQGHDPSLVRYLYSIPVQSRHSSAQSLPIICMSPLFVYICTPFTITDRLSFNPIRREVSECTSSQLRRPPMDSPTDSPHPHPSAFTRIESEVRAILSQSLKSFVRASYHNVTTYRALCGIIGGSVIALLTGVLPLILTIFLSSNRWLRWVAWPGLTVGSTIIVASTNGVCVGIYIFGDWRQLRNFELLRPRIEKTPALAIKPISPISITDVPSPPSPAEVIRQRWLSQVGREQKVTSSQISIHSALTAVSEMLSTQGGSTMDIYVSPAMDPDTGEYSPTASVHQEDSEYEMRVFPRTAKFIPHESYDREMSQTEARTLDRQEHQFDFNGLPPLSPERDCLEEKDSIKSPVPSASDSQCDSASRRIEAVDLERGAKEEGGNPEKSNSQVPLPDVQLPKQGDLHYGNVAPFGPVTHVLNPIVIRAQWEIVARSSFIGALISLAIVGAIVGIPEVKFMSTMPLIIPSAGT